MFFFRHHQRAHLLRIARDPTEGEPGHRVAARFHFQRQRARRQIEVGNYERAVGRGIDLHLAIADQPHPRADGLTLIDHATAQVARAAATELDVLAAAGVHVDEKARLAAGAGYRAHRRREIEEGEHSVQRRRGIGQRGDGRNHRQRTQRAEVNRAGAAERQQQALVGEWIARHRIEDASHQQTVRSGLQTFREVARDHVDLVAREQVDRLVLIGREGRDDPVRREITVGLDAQEQLGAAGHLRNAEAAVTAGGDLTVLRETDHLDLAAGDRQRRLRIAGSPFEDGGGQRQRVAARRSRQLAGLDLPHLDREVEELFRGIRADHERRA